MVESTAGERHILALDRPNLLRDAVRIVAQIHHSHGIKAMLALLRLRDAFVSWGDDFWHESLQRVYWDKEPRTAMLPLDEGIEWTHDSKHRRAAVLVERAVMPTSYFACRAWIERDGADAVLRSYARQGAADPGYLGHRLSILLAFTEAWPLYSGTADELRLVERLVEYLIACRFSARNDHPLSLGDPQAALAAVLKRPGFFGHHLITLAWALRSSEWLGPECMASVCAWAVEAAATHYADDEDNVIIEASTYSGIDAEPALRSLLQYGQRNIHLLTLADSILWLWGRATAEQRGSLEAIARHYAGG